MPIDRYRAPTIPSGGFSTSPGRAPAMSMFGSLRAPVPSVGLTGSGLRAPSMKTREANPIERLDLAVSEYAPGILRAPAVMAERPLAYLDAFTGGGVNDDGTTKPGGFSNVLKAVGDFGGSNGQMGPVGQFFKGVTDGLIAVGDAGRAWGNSWYAEQVALHGNKSRDTVIDVGGGGILDFFTGGGGKKMTVGELQDELDARGWRRDPKTGEMLSWQDLQAKAQENRFAFGDRAMSSSIALDTLASMVYDPLNLLVFVPGAGWAAVGAKAAAGGARAARWARPVTTAASAMLKTPLRYGHGYLRDPAISVLRASKMPELATSAADILAGSTRFATLRGVASAADSVLRGGATGLGKFTGYSAPTKGGALAKATALGGAYYKGAFKLHVGSVGAEFGAGIADNIASNSFLEGTIVDGGTSLVHSALQKLNNAHPLSENESFMLMALVTMPTVPLVKEAVGTPGRMLRNAVGDNDAVLIAKQLYPDMDGKAAMEQLYTKAGDGNAKRGREVIHWALQQAERGAAYKELGLSTKHLGSLDAVASNATVLNSILGSKVKRMREAGTIRAQTRVQTFMDVVRKGEIVTSGDRPFEWNASPDAIVKFWGRMYTAWEAIAPAAQKLGVTALQTSKIVTKEAASNLRAAILKDAPETGIIPGWVRDEVLLQIPGLMDDPKAYGDFWAQLAVHSTEQSISGRVATKAGRNAADNRLNMEQLRTELDKLVDDSPTSAELFHEAEIMERAQTDGTVVDALAGNKLRKVHSPKKIKKLLEDATGDAKALRAEHNVLAGIRNSQYTRNGLPKYKTIDATVGYRNTAMKRTTVKDAQGRETTAFEVGYDGDLLIFDADDPTVFRLGSSDGDILATPNLASEMIVKAVELGGRVLVHDADSRVLYNHGFVEVARRSEVRRPSGPAFDALNDRRDAAYRRLMNGDKSDENMKLIEQLDAELERMVRDGVQVEVGYYAFTGGNPTGLRSLIYDGYDGPIKSQPVFDPDVEGLATDVYVPVPAQPEMIPIDALAPFVEIDRELVPKFRDDPLYLDRLTEDLDAVVMGEIGPSAIDPVTIEWDMGSEAAMLTDGNHRYAALRRLQIKYGRKFEIPVQIKVVMKQFGADEAQHAPIKGSVVTASEITGFMRGAFPPYKPSNRIVKNHDAGVRLARARADKASLLVASTDAIGPAPTSAEGLFHGSRNLFDEFDAAFLSDTSLVGRGVYTTDSAGVAMGYSGPDGNLYRVEIPDGLKTFDLEQDLRPESAWQLRADLEEAAFSALEGRPDMQNIVSDIFEEEATGIGIFRRLFDVMFDGGNYDQHPLGLVNNAMIETFRKHGYEGFTHIGGRIVGNVEHNVTVVFDPKQVKIVERLNARDIVSDVGARHKVITRRMEQIKENMRRQAKTIEEINQRAEELRTVKLPENFADMRVDPAAQEELRGLVSRVRAEYPAYELSAGEGVAFWDPADGLIPALRLERSTAQSLVFDYGPMSRISSLYDNLFAPISSKRLSKMARTAVYNKMLAEGATTKQIGQVLQELQTRVREAVVGPLRTPYFRDITSLPATQVNEIARRFLDDKTWAQIEKRYGRNGFHRLLDESSHEFVRRVDKMVVRGQKPGALARSLREGYRLWTNTPVVGSTTRIVSKQFYHIFRFMLDLRWHFLNLIEADVLALGREGFGSTRLGKKPSDTDKHALLQHSAKAGIPGEYFSAGPAKGDIVNAGPASAMELFDVGMYLHNRNILPIVANNFKANRLRSVESALDQIPTGSSVHRMLVERFGSDGRSWSKQLDDMMYNFDQKGVRQTVFETARKDGWTDADIVEFGTILEKITELNQRAYDDIVSVYTGNLERTRIERIMNSYWLYWPISYQIKATKWMFDVLLNRMAGKQTNMTGLYLFNRVQERFQDQLLNNPQFQQEMEQNEDLWFAANMLFPATPMDIGASLNRGVRYATSLVAPDVIPPYVGIDGAEDIGVRMLEMGPIYTARFIQTIINDANRKQNDSSDRALPGRKIDGPLVLPSP